jgi:hypothetical protein
MARASASTLATLAPLLNKIRAIAALTERNPGIFYLKREPMLHFHDNGRDASQTVAHLKAAGGGFDEFAVANAAERAALLAEIKQRCAARQKA